MTPKEEVASIAIERFHGHVRPVTLGDIDRIREILAMSIIDRGSGVTVTEEIEEIDHAIRDSLAGKNDYNYVVAEEGGMILGVAGIRAPLDPRLEPLVKTVSPVEVVNVYVDIKKKVRGVGRALMDELEKTARNKGYTEIILSSGPRYKESAWGFYEKVIGNIECFIPTRDNTGKAAVWRKEL